MTLRTTEENTFAAKWKKIVRKIPYFLPFLIFLLLGCFLVSRNYFKRAYQKQEPVSLEEAKKDHSVDGKVGYPAGNDIPAAKSIDDITHNPYCTIEVSGEDIVPTHSFRIKDITKSSWRYSTSRKRKRTKIRPAYALYDNFMGNLLYSLRQVGWNKDSVSYGEYCVVTLESGERIFALIDLQLLDLPAKEKIRLPIGKVYRADVYASGYLKYDKYQVDKENSSWYLNMVGSWEKKEGGKSPSLIIYLVCFFAAVISFAVAHVHVKEKFSEKQV